MYLSFIHILLRVFYRKFYFAFLWGFSRSYNTLFLPHPFVRILLDHVVLELPGGNLPLEHYVNLEVATALHLR